MAPERPSDDLQLTPALRLPAAELRWRFSRSSGAGGQHVNATDSRVELVFDLAATQALPPLLKTRALRRLETRLVAGTVVIAVQEQRSQWQNRATALRRLAALLQEAFQPAPPPRRPTRPSLGSRQRRLAAKRLRSALKGQRRGLQLEE
jgi:ribosome-associated protein